MKSSRVIGVASLLVAVALVFAAGPVGAAEEPSEEGDEEIPEGPLGEQLEDYWSVDRDVDVIKQRLYEREGRFSVGLLGGLMASQPFFQYLPVGLRLDYYLTNNWGIELEGEYMDGFLRVPTDLTSFVGDEKGDGFDPALHALDRFRWRAHALAVWYPLYGKLAALQRKLIHFDLNLVAGFGAVGLARPNEIRTESNDIVTVNFVYGGGVQVYATENIVVRASGRAYIYRGPRRYKNTDTGERVVSEPPGSGNSKELNFIQELEFPTEFLLGVNYLF